MNVKIDPSWKKVLQKEFNQSYFSNIVQHIKTEKAQKKTIYPTGNNIFNAFNLTPFENVKVVILGQDPYHGPGQAHGLCFSVLKGVDTPPSLQNIYKELNQDIGLPIPKHGELTNWAKQGVFLLNASLTVRASEPMSHSKIGWANFTDAVIKHLSDKKKNLVFILWGKFAQEKKLLIDESKHLILTSAHPSPLSAHTGFFGSKHFSKTNEYLASHGIDPIDWQID